MEQHPVPQPITSYEFRLVGDMTLKQFAKLASGVILALIVYGFNPPGLIKWFLIVLFVAIGVGMAFFPFEGRSIDTWIIAFFKRIYSPTQYIWKQSSKTKTTPVTNPIPATPLNPPLSPSFKQAIATPIPKFQADLSFRKPPATIFPPPTLKPMGKKIETKFTPNIVIPATPSLPNLIVGYVRNKEEKIIEGAILEIRDSAGNPTRALKTNKLGQFLIATPLPNGEYEIETDKEGFAFDIMKISLRGEIISPIEIVSKN